MVEDASGGEDLEQNTLLHRARRVASVGLFGAAVGAVIPVMLPAVGAAVTAELIGLGLGLAAGVVLTVKHLV